jgi:hypothetical protein
MKLKTLIMIIKVKYLILTREEKTTQLVFQIESRKMIEMLKNLYMLTRNTIEEGIRERN